MNNDMKTNDYIRLQAQVAILREIANDYQGKTIENIIHQMEARLEEGK